MVSFRSGVVAAITALSVLGSVQAAPLADKLRRLSSSARDTLKRSIPAAPRFVAYNDKWTAFPSASELKARNTALTFLMTSGAADQAQNWQELTASQRASYVQEYNAAGISLIVSAFGSTETPTSSGVDPTSTANTMANWVITYGANGIDVDYEDFTAFNGAQGTAERWLITFTQQLRTKLPQGQYILTHARIRFAPSKWSGGGYVAVDKSVGSLIDWYNVQVKTPGTSEYTTCSGLLTASSSTWPQSALFQIVASGVSQDKLLIGKPATTSDSANGYMAPSTLASCVSQAASHGWNGGVMGWQYPDATSSWIITVRGNTWPVSGVPPSSGNGNCAGVSPWAGNVDYSSGNEVTYNGDLWTANTWNENETPGGSSGAWTNDGACT
ncbi:carbohydrate-binding module family 5 protein [Tylopilus felleus]